MELFPLIERATKLALLRRGVTTRTLETSSGPVHVYDAPGTGSLAPVVLVHGFGASASTFAPMLSSLRRMVSRVIVPELPGHGLSGRAARPLSPEVVYEGLRDAIDRTTSAPFLLFGNSLGGAVSMRLAIDRPDRVRGLFLASPAGAPMSDDEFAEVRSIFRPRDDAEARAFFTRAYTQQKWFYPVFAGPLRRHFSQDSFQHFLSVTDPRGWLETEALKSLPMPVRLSWGGRDRILPASLMRFYRANLPANAVIEEPADEGHCPHVDDPRGLAERIASFARELEGA